jgi:hypothetical protein
LHHTETQKERRKESRTPDLLSLSEPENIFLSFMKSAIIFFHSVLIICFFAKNVLAQETIASGNANRDSFDIKTASFFLPHSVSRNGYQHAISANFVVLPKDWTLDAINAPMFFYEGKYSFTNGIDLQGSLATLFISNRVLLGPFWHHTVGNYHFGAGYQVAFNYGFLNHFGYKSRLIIWETQPSVSVGYSFEKTALTFKFSLCHTNSIHETHGGHTINYNESFVNGYTGSLHYEQRLTRNKIIFLGFKLDNFRYHIIAWPAFPVNGFQYWIPEIQIGTVL